MSGIEYYNKLNIDCKIHLKKALLNVLHNEIGDPTLTGIPKDPKKLYNYLQDKKKKDKIKKEFFAHQKAILLPTNTQSVDSKQFDVTLIRRLIHDFCNIKNAKGNMKEPDKNDTALWAYVYRAADMRNKIAHKGDIIKYDEKEYKEEWEKMKEILDALKYKGDTRVFLQLLKDYKDYSSKNTSEEFHVERRLSVKKNRNEREIIYGDDVTAMGQVLEENDRVLVYGEAGIGKTYMSRQIKRDWSKEKLLPNSYLLYFESKKINQKDKHRSREAPFFFSDMGEVIGKTYETFLLYDCVTRQIDDLFILVDGVDEFPIKNLLKEEDVNRLEIKVRKDEEITAAETIYAIYYGFLFPNAKICLLGRKGEFLRLKKVIDERKTSTFNRKSVDLELLKFNEENIKDFTRFKISNQQHTGACEEIHEMIKDVDLCKVPTNLNSCLELLKQQPNIDIGRITRTKILIATLLNRLNKHVYKRMKKRYESFREIRDEEIFDEYLKCIGAMAEISFNALLNGVVTVEGVLEKRGYLKDKKNIEVNRTCLEELDLFYIRNNVYNFTLEPYHTLSIEFLTACHLFSHPAKWDLILKLTEDRQLVIIALIAGLLVADPFTNDFVEYVFNISDYSLEKFFSWLSGPYPQILINPGKLKDLSYFLTPNQQISPSINLLESIFHEVEVQDNLDSDSFLDRFQFEYYNRFPKYKFKIRFVEMKMDEENFNFMKNYKENNRVSIIICAMYFRDIFESFFDFGLSLEVIRVDEYANSSSITKFLTALSSPSPSIKCKSLVIEDITKFNENQIRKLFAICLNGTVESIKLLDYMFTAEQIKILKEIEGRYTTKQIDLGMQNFALMGFFGFESFRRQRLVFRHVLDLPNLGSRKLILNRIDVDDDNLREFRKHVIPGPCCNLSKYKILYPDGYSFQRKNDNSQGNETLMCLHLSKVDFGHVTPKVFASTFRLIPSLACTDDDRYIPSIHWKSLSKAKGCQINVLRIWYPKSDNYAYFLNIKLKIIQFVNERKDELKELLDHIVRSPNVQQDKRIKVFRVSFNEYHFEKYEEVTLFSRETIKDYKENRILDNSRIDEVQQAYYEGEEFNKYWCCEISLPFRKSSSSDYESSNEESEDELNDGNCSILKKCCCCFPKL